MSGEQNGGWTAWSHYVLEALKKNTLEIEEIEERCTNRRQDCRDCVMQSFNNVKSEFDTLGKRITLLEESEAKIKTISDKCMLAMAFSGAFTIIVILLAILVLIHIH